MNDDELERRLRRALNAEAHDAVKEERPIPAMSRSDDPGRLPWRALPLLAAAVVVTAIVAGSTVLVRLDGHVTPHNLDSASTPPVATSGPTGYATGSASPTRSRPTVAGPSGSTATPSVPRTTSPSSPGVPPSTPPSGAGTSSGAQPGTNQPGQNQPTPNQPTPNQPTQKPPAGTGSARPTGHPSSHHAPTPSPTTGPGSAPPPGQVRPCTSTSLTLAVGGDRLVGTNGDYTFLELTNTGPTCSLDGYPVVRIFDPAEHVAAGPATHRAGPAAQRIMVTHGQAAEFEVYDVVSSAPSCTPSYTTGRTLQMYPPGQGTPITIDYGYSACGLSVTSIHQPQAHPATS